MPAEVNGQTSVTTAIKTEFLQMLKFIAQVQDD